MSNTTGKTTISEILSQSGKKAFELEMRQFYLEEAKRFYALMKRKPQHTEQIIRILDNYKKLYEGK